MANKVKKVKEVTKVVKVETGVIKDEEKLMKRAKAGGYEILPRVVSVKGVSIPKLKSRLIERVGRKAFYRRDDGVYEVFEVKVREASSRFGRDYPKREVYPTNEDFGRTAECFSDYEEAKKYYDNFMRRSLKGVKL